MSPPRPDSAAGVFETLLLRDGQVHALAAHLDRLESSTRALYGRPLPDRSRLAGALTRAAAEHPHPRRARVDAVPGPDGLTVRLTTGPVPAVRPVVLAPLRVTGGLGAHKWRDRRLVESPGATAVPLVVDDDDSVLEAAWANLWIQDGDELITPPLDGRILPGVTRGRLLALAPRLGLRAREAPIALGRARAAPTLFLTSSLRLAVPAALDRAPGDHPEIDRIRQALAGGA